MTFIIAEAGVNHCGDFGTALKLVDAAKQSHADAVKFQLFNSQKLWGDDRIKHLELSQDQMRDVASYCKAVEIEFMCTPFGVEEAVFLRPLIKRVKIASGCLKRTEILDAVWDMPLILSTGMATLEEIRNSLLYLGSNVTLLQCTSSYPCRLEDVNLRAMVTLQKTFGLPVGFSDHTTGITSAIAAAALGATVIEKHLTLDRNAEGPDHKASVTPISFAAMVDGIRAVELALGDGVKRVMDSEQALKKAWHANA